MLERGRLNGGCVTSVHGPGDALDKKELMRLVGDDAVAVGSFFKVDEDGRAIGIFFEHSQNIIF